MGPRAKTLAESEGGFANLETSAGSDYGLGTIGTYLRPPSARGPPSDQKNNPMITVKKGRENDKNGGIV